MLWLITPTVFADLGTTANQSANTSTTSNTSETLAQDRSSANKDQDSEAIDKFFKDADYEHLAPEKGTEFVDAGYLGGSSAN